MPSCSPYRPVQRRSRTGAIGLPGGFAALVAVAMILSSSCSRGGGDTAGTATTVPQSATTASSTAAGPADTTGAADATDPATDSTAGQGDGAATDDPPTSGATDPEALCEGLSVEQTGEVTSELDELSGLARSDLRPDLLWAHNDSGNAVVLHALDTTGAQLGAVTVAGLDAIDIEDMAIADGMVYLADIGDNDRARSEIAIHRFPEPEPGASTVPTSEVETMRLRYPDRAHDAEAFLVDPIDGTMVIITKEIAFGAGENGTLLVAAEAPVYTVDTPFDSSEVGELRLDGAVALDRLDPLIEGQGPRDGLVAQFGGAGVATGADIRADGGAIALRTYETVWLFHRPEGTTVAEALAGEPCAGPVAYEPQGEAVAFLDTTTTAYVTVSELDPAIHVARPS